MKNNSITVEVYNDIKDNLTPMQMIATTAPTLFFLSVGVIVSAMVGMKFELQNKKENDIYE